MRIIADTHLHFYPCYDIGKALACLTRNLGALSGEGGVMLGFLAERRGCDFFGGLLGGTVRAGSGFDIRAGADGQSVCVRRAGGGDGVEPPSVLHLLPGRQVVTLERLEILALATPGQVPDGLPAAEVVGKTLEQGGVPVLAWAPGKWFFRRGRIVRDLIRVSGPRSLLIGDSSLRPGIWREPFLMRAARQRGFRLVAGSDPLPFEGEERVMGSYASRFDGVFDSSRALHSARELLWGGPLPVSVGCRSAVATVLQRIWKNARAKQGK